MTLELQIWMLLGSLVYLGIIFWMLKTKRLSVRFSIVWLFSAFALVLFAAVPYVVYVLRDIFRHSNALQSGICHDHWLYVANSSQPFRSCYRICRPH